MLRQVGQRGGRTADHGFVVVRAELSLSVEYIVVFINAIEYDFWRGLDNLKKDNKITFTGHCSKILYGMRLPTFLGTFRMMTARNLCEPNPRQPNRKIPVNEFMIWKIG